MNTKPHDALAIVKLYEIRSESLMRQARAWFFTEFNPKSGFGDSGTHAVMSDAVLV